MPVSPSKSNFYAEWRRRQGRTLFLRDSGGLAPFGTERLLQIIWYHQRLLRDQLRTLDGRPVHILHPGFWNHESGPDFRGAVVQVGDEPAKTGDVEIDLRPEGWREHGHDRNPNFKNVILHVLWEAGSDSGAPAPALALKTFLDSPIEELDLWLGSESAQNYPAALAGHCCAPLCELSEEKMAELLQQAAFVRLQRKASEFQARAREAGWEQALWEGLFRGLGYKNNVWPMQRLAELLANSGRGTSEHGTGSVELGNFSRSEVPRSAFFWQAWLFGMSGLLPTQPEESENDVYLRGIWEIWWRERHASSDLIFSKSLWRFNGLRPANFPQRRLALAAHWLADKRFFSKLENWFTDPTSAEPLPALHELLQVNDDEFWCRHWNFRSVRLAEAQSLIGAARVSDLAVNVVLPWLWMRAVVGKNELLQRRAEKLFFEWPAAEDNSVLRLARQRLLAGASPRKFKTAAAQQGLLQIVRDFCNHSNAICADCQFPDLVRGWSLQSSA